MPTFNANVLPASTGFDLGSAAALWDGFFQQVHVGDLSNINFADSNANFATAQAAIDDFSSNRGLVVIPSDYGGAEPTSVPSNVSILDLRATAAVAGTTSQAKLVLSSGNTTPLNDIGGLFPSFPRRGLLLVQDEIADSGAGSSGVVESAEDCVQVAIRTLDPHKDVVAVYGQAIMDVAADGGGVWGANFQAIGGADLDTKLVGLEIDVSNQNTGGALGSETKGALFINAFSGTIGPAILVGTGDSGTGRFQNGITFNDNSMDESAGALFGAATGTYNNGIDFSLATFNGNAMRIRNTEGIVLLGTAAAHANIFNNSDNFLNIVSGSAGTVIRNQALTQNNLTISDSGTVSLANGSLNLRPTRTLDNTGTPSIVLGNVFTTGGTTSITAFDNGVDGQIIYIVSAHSVTITDGASLHLNGGNFAMTDNDTLTLVFDGSEWYETGRSVD